VKLQKELFDLLEKYGLEAPEVSLEDTVEVETFFKWLHACVMMLDAGAHFHEDISAVVAVCTLSVAVYGLFLADAGNAGSVTKAQLCSLHDEGFFWPEEDVVRPEVLPALAKKHREELHGSFLQRRRSCARATRG